MKRFLHLVCLLVVAVLLPVALLISRGLPADTRPYVEQKYAGWNGVLRAWVCADWNCAGSFTRWLNTCAASFEKKHDGVYIEFTPISVDMLRQMNDSGIRPPELVFFSPGTWTPSSLKDVAVPDALRSELRGIRGNACPVAMGGYIWVYNRELADGAPTVDSAIASLPDDGARSFSAALIGLLSDVSENTDLEEALPEIGLDLGLPAAAVEASGFELDIASDALDRFIRGELSAVPVTQAELSRLIRLRDAGRGPDWDCAAAGRVAYTDQLLMLGVVAQSGDTAQEREALAEAFAASLLDYESQAKLADIGAFSVIGERIYSDFSAYAALDTLLNSRELIVPANVAQHPLDCTNLLRAHIAGAQDSLDRLREALQ